jgi:hypothetical protein
MYMYTHVVRTCERYTRIHVVDARTHVEDNWRYEEERCRKDGMSLDTQGL